MKCKHEPRAMYRINERSIAAVFLAPHRARDWYVCDKCGKVGLRSKYRRTIHWRGQDPELVQRADKWNEWAEKQKADV